MTTTEGGATSLAQAWQELLDEKFPSGVNVKNVGADGLLEPPVRNIPVLMVAELRADWPVLWGMPVEAPGLDFRVAVASWEELDREAGDYAVRVSQAAEDLPDLVLEQVTDVMAERMDEWRTANRQFLAAQIQAGMAARLAASRGVDPDEISDEEVVAEGPGLDQASDAVREALGLASRES